MKNFKKLNRLEMKEVLGGNMPIDPGTKSTCTISCSGGTAVSIADCEVNTAQGKCGNDLSRAECKCITITT